MKTPAASAAPGPMPPSAPANDHSTAAIPGLPPAAASPPGVVVPPIADTPRVAAAPSTAPKSRSKIPTPHLDKAPASASVPTTQATLDLASLQQRLRDTRAIGVFTKLSLKNQVDDLLAEFRDCYKQPKRRPTPEMRGHFDALLLKVLNLLQDGDPVLAAAISSSKEAIWQILADPDKFSKI